MEGSFDDGDCRALREDIEKELQKILDEDWEDIKGVAFMKQLLLEASFDDLSLCILLFGRFYFHLMEEQGRLVRVRTFETRRRRKRNG